MVPAGPLVSFIIPAFQCERTVNRMIDSILVSCLSDFEVIVVDDGSTDATAKVLEESYASDSRVRIISQENQGRCVARNKGLSVARGKWVVFADADDYFTEDAGKIFDSYLNCTDVCLIVFAHKMIVSACGTGVSRNADNAAYCIDSSTVRCEDLFKAMCFGFDETETFGLYRGFEFNACWAHAYRRDLLLDLADYLSEGYEPFQEGMRYSEDRLLNIAYLRKNKNQMIRLVPAQVYVWDMSQSGTCAVVKRDDVLNPIKYDRALRELRCKGLLEEGEEQALLGRELIHTFMRMAGATKVDLKDSDIQKVFGSLRARRAICNAPHDCKGLKRSVAVFLLEHGHPSLAIQLYKTLFKFSGVHNRVV